jgi:hypothetical protein
LKSPQPPNNEDKMFGKEDRDIEKQPAVGTGTGNLLYDEATGAVHGESFEYGDSLYARLQRFAGKLNVEQRGIERVPDDERTDTSYLNVGSMVCLGRDGQNVICAPVG